MGRSPCCDKMGLKKGPWTDDEDRILVSYIQAHGHSNWRALPKLAGLQRCGKSCRLRWMNYLRPDIKRGNFTEEEEEAIIYLHRLLGNRWSAIAARLPGRTDNEIKNVWHTHLKKRVQKKEDSNDPLFLRASGGGAASSSPSSEVSTSMTSASDSMATNEVTAAQNWENGLEVNDSFWADALAMDGSVTSANFSLDFQETALFPEDDELDYWINVLRDGGDMADIMFS